jgi:agmatinase
MAGPPTFAIPPGFLGVTRHDPGAGIVIAGIPLDIGTTNRAGARDGPAAIRRASRMLTDGAHPHHWVDPATLDLADGGDFAIALGDIQGSLALIERQAAPLAHLVALGGDHGVTLALLRALRRRLGAKLAVVHFDAHVDTWPDNFGQRYAHGSVFFHAINEGLVDPARMVQLGIRSPVQREVWDWTVGQGVTILTAQQIHETGPDAIAAEIRRVIGAALAYLSFDIDALDPAFAPATGTPEVGGLATWQAQAILRRLGGPGRRIGDGAIDFRGMDLVEVAPAYDTAEITALAGATLVWEYLALIGAR